SRVVFLDGDGVKQYSTEGYANALYAYLSSQSPAAILSGATSQAKDYFPRLAAKFKVGIASDCTELQLGGGKVQVRRPVYAGKCSKAVEFLKSPAVFTVRPNVLAVGTGPTKTAQVENVAAQSGIIRAKIAEVKASGAKKVDLTEADIIISGGR